MSTSAESELDDDELEELEEHEEDEDDSDSDWDDSELDGHEFKSGSSTDSLSRAILEKKDVSSFMACRISWMNVWRSETVGIKTCKIMVLLNYARYSSSVSEVGVELRYTQN